MIMPHVRLGDGTLAYLLVRDSRTQEIGFVSGGVRNQETFEQAAVRELHEETAGAVRLANLKGHWRFRYQVVTQRKERWYLCDYVCYIVDVTGRLDPHQVKRDYRRRSAALEDAAAVAAAAAKAEADTQAETRAETRAETQAGEKAEAPAAGTLARGPRELGKRTGTLLHSAVETCDVMFERITDVPPSLMWTVCADVMRSRSFRCAHGYFESRNAGRVSVAAIC
jgi:8-oxo-dGTP pyrophosphatase MutT (NUDIX family)